MAARKPAMGGVGSNQYGQRGRPSANPRATRQAVEAAIETEQVAEVFAQDGYDPKRARSRAAILKHAGSPNAPDRRAIATRKSTPPEVLDVLADDDDIEVVENVATNPRTPAEALLRIAQTHRALAHTVERNSSCPPEALRYLALTVGGETFETGALIHPSCPPDVLEVLADRHPRLVAMHLNAPGTVLSRLARGGTDVDNGYALQNPSCPPATLIEALSSPVQPQRYNALKNQNCPPMFLEAAFRSHDHSLREVSAGNPNLPDACVLEAANDFPWGRVGPRAAAMPDCPPALMSRLADLGSPETREVLVARADCPDSLLGRFLSSNSWQLALAAVNHPNLGPENTGRARSSKFKSVRVRAEERRREQRVAGGQ